MVSRPRLTIQDYLNHAGIGADIGRSRSNRAAAGNDFAKVLENLQSSVQNPPATSRGGMQIGDYWRRPISARIPAVTLPPQSDRPDEPFLDEQSPIAEMPFILPESSGPAEYSEAPAAGLSKSSPAEHSAGDRISTGIQAAASKYDLPPELIHSVIRAESNFQPKAVSTAGAQGLMQLMPATAEAMGVKDPFDIEQNIDGGARYLRQMLDRFDGDLKRALAAYNAGPGTVMRYNGNVPYAETRDYVRKVLHYAKQYRV